MQLLPPNSPTRRRNFLATIAQPELARLATESIRPTAANIILAGDRAKILPAVQHFGFEVIELTPDSTPVVPR
jgi:hypothetical protein